MLRHAPTLLSKAVNNVAQDPFMHHGVYWAFVYCEWDTVNSPNNAATIPLILRRVVNLLHLLLRKNKYSNRDKQLNAVRAQVDWSLSGKALVDAFQVAVMKDALTDVVLPEPSKHAILLALGHMQAKDYAAADVELDRAFRLKAEYCFQRSEYIGAFEPDYAWLCLRKKWLDQAVDLDSKNEKYLAALAEVEKQLKSTHQMPELEEKVATARKNLVTQYEMISTTLLLSSDQESLQKIIAAATDALKLYPSAFAYSVRGHAYSKLNRRGEALSDYAHLILIDKKYEAVIRHILSADKSNDYEQLNLTPCLSSEMSRVRIYLERQDFRSALNKLNIILELHDLAGTPIIDADRAAVHILRNDIHKKLGLAQLDIDQIDDNLRSNPDVRWRIQTFSLESKEEEKATSPMETPLGKLRSQTLHDVLIDGPLNAEQKVRAKQLAELPDYAQLIYLHGRRLLLMGIPGHNDYFDCLPVKKDFLVAQILQVLTTSPINLDSLEKQNVFVSNTLQYATIFKDLANNPEHYFSNCSEEMMAQIHSVNTRYEGVLKLLCLDDPLFLVWADPRDVIAGGIEEKHIAIEKQLHSSNITEEELQKNEAILTAELRLRNGPKDYFPYTYLQYLSALVRIRRCDFVGASGILNSINTQYHPIHFHSGAKLVQMIGLRKALLNQFVNKGQHLLNFYQQHPTLPAALALEVNHRASGDLVSLRNLTENIFMNKDYPAAIRLQRGLTLFSHAQPPTRAHIHWITAQDLKTLFEIMSQSTSQLGDQLLAQALFILIRYAPMVSMENQHKKRFSSVEANWLLDAVWVQKYINPDLISEFIWMAMLYPDSIVGVALALRKPTIGLFASDRYRELYKQALEAEVPKDLVISEGQLTIIKDARFKAKYSQHCVKKILQQFAEEKHDAELVHTLIRHLPECKAEELTSDYGKGIIHFLTDLASLKANDRLKTSDLQKCVPQILAWVKQYGTALTKDVCMQMLNPGSFFKGLFNEKQKKEIADGLEMVGSGPLLIRRLSL